MVLGLIFFGFFFGTTMASIALIGGGLAATLVACSIFSVGAVVSVALLATALPFNRAGALPRPHHPALVPRPVPLAPPSPAPVTRLPVQARSRAHDRGSSAAA